MLMQVRTVELNGELRDRLRARFREPEPEVPSLFKPKLRWYRFLRHGHKVDRPMKRTIQHEDTQTVYPPPRSRATVVMDGWSMSHACDVTGLQRSRLQTIVPYR